MTIFPAHSMQPSPHILPVGVLVLMYGALATVAGLNCHCDSRADGMIAKPKLEWPTGPVLSSQEWMDRRGVEVEGVGRWKPTTQPADEFTADDGGE